MGTEIPGTKSTRTLSQDHLLSRNVRFNIKIREPPPPLVRRAPALRKLCPQNAHGPHSRAEEHSCTPTGPIAHPLPVRGLLIHEGVGGLIWRTPPPPPRDALEGKGPARRPQERLDRRLEEVAKAVGGGYYWLQMPLKLALGVRGTVAEHRLGALEGYLPPFQCLPAPPPPPQGQTAYPKPQKICWGKGKF